mmetsp:Transcript_18797/g.35481  ORF Transcript_18797/g.35481 Transcript_18797/m.35481 type:complete len:80 (+) Transcript_18797:1-240(+)
MFKWATKQGFQLVRRECVNQVLDMYYEGASGAARHVELMSNAAPKLAVVFLRELEREPRTHARARKRKTRESRLEYPVW